jgi:hypothetical protein
MALLKQTHLVEFGDGRRARVREYDDGSVRFGVELGGFTGYSITEAFLSEGNSGWANIKVIPREA